MRAGDVIWWDEHNRYADRHGNREGYMFEGFEEYEEGERPPRYEDVVGEGREGVGWTGTDVDVERRRERMPGEYCE